MLFFIYISVCRWRCICYNYATLREQHKCLRFLFPLNKPFSGKHAQSSSSWKSVWTVGIHLKTLFVWPYWTKANYIRFIYSRVVNVLSWSALLKRIIPHLSGKDEVCTSAKLWAFPNVFFSFFCLSVFPTPRHPEWHGESHLTIFHKFPRQLEEDNFYFFKGCQAARPVG